MEIMKDYYSINDFVMSTPKTQFVTVKTTVS